MYKLGLFEIMLRLVASCASLLAVGADGGAMQAPFWRVKFGRQVMQVEATRSAILQLGMETCARAIVSRVNRIGAFIGFIIILVTVTY